MKKRALKKTTAGKVKRLIEALVITWMGILHLSLDALKRVVEVSHSQQLSLGGQNAPTLQIYRPDSSVTSHPLGVRRRDRQHVIRRHVTQPQVLCGHPRSGFRPLLVGHQEKR